ncbi:MULTISPECIES: hypothetical protein [Pandoraea]|uniref:hypothetical protein n=1 Tax=Pandoraea TaxID=93217 RepID=UPI001F5DC38B|nr:MULTISPECIES: hypothetical protein [Pandoraea]
METHPAPTPEYASLIRSPVAKPPAARAERVDVPVTSRERTDVGTPSPALLKLMRGQSFHTYASRGTVLQVRDGNVMLTPPARWLAAGVWRPTVPLAAGQVYVVETSGWFAIASDGGASVASRVGASDLRLSDDQRPPATGRLQAILRYFGL